MRAADFLVLPSHREGFGAVIIEAAACGIPSIGTKIYGLTDAIVKEKTGLLVPPKNHRALARAMISFGRQHKMRQTMGRAARRRAQRDFRQEDVIRAILHHHEEALKEA
jgi:glycosyltransferase involved in cell wall biosynthesis